jgi:phage baseplate assembly protein W
MNHIFTEKGERVMMPGFGTRIPLLTFEPCDEKTKAVVTQDLTEVFNSDPRVELISLNVYALPSNNAIIANCTLLFIEFEVQGELNIHVNTQ